MAEEKTKEEIDSKLGLMSEFLKIEYLENYLQENITLNIRQYIHLKLALLYEGRKMFWQAAKNMEDAAEIETTFKGKIQYFVKAAELYIKAGHEHYDAADVAWKKAASQANTIEKKEIKAAIKNLYLSQAEKYEYERKNNNASKAYERLLHMADAADDINEKQRIKEKLLLLYKKLGKIREATLIESED